MKVIKNLILSMLIGIAITGCQKSKEVSLTIFMDNVSETEAVINGTAAGADLDLAAADSYVTDIGFCYNKTGNPTIADATQHADINANIKNAFSTTLQKLEPGTTYYVRAYAQSDACYYSNELTFTTLDAAPTISLTSDKTTLESGGSATFTIQAAANDITNSELATVVFDIVCSGENVYTNSESVNAATYSKEYELSFNGSEGDVFEVSATVTDNAGKTAVATVTVTIANPAVLVEAPFTWNRYGNGVGTGLEEFGLQWVSNAAKSLYAVIEPVYGAKMCRLLPEEYANVTNAAQLQALVDNSASIQYWKEFDVTVSTPQTFDVVLATCYNNQYHIIHITNGVCTTIPTGIDATLTGMAK